MPKLIKEVTTDLDKMLTDILHYNYELLGNLVKSDFTQEQLKTECKGLVNQNQFISNFLKDVSIGICMTTVKEKPKEASEKDQFSKLTKTDRDQINKLLIEKFGEEITKTKKESTKTPYEYSCVAIYEFLNMTWTFEN